MGAPPIHDKYGKKVMQRAFGKTFNPNPGPISFGIDAGTFKIDGIIGEDIAVEIESLASKQARGAIVDIICHPFPKKLVVLIEKYGNKYTENQCRVLLDKFAPDVVKQVITLHGSGTNEKISDDVQAVKDAVEKLRQSALDHKK